MINNYYNLDYESIKVSLNLDLNDITKYFLINHTWKVLAD